ncbi:MAG TPA: hypothetical protein VJ777_01430, partial [Mycobacterium sp.]|nr:hypothetical protein [Mycobacterium sp.]
MVCPRDVEPPNEVTAAPGVARWVAWSGGLENRRANPARIGGLPVEDLGAQQQCRNAGDDRGSETTAGQLPDSPTGRGSREVLTRR